MSAISIPNTVKKIGDRAFYYCESLEEVTFPGSVESFGEYLFYGSGIKRVTLSEGITTLDENTFRSAETLESVSLPDTLTTIGDRAFYYCESLKEIEIPAV